MGKLILTLDGRELAQYELEKERYTVGRMPDNDILIENMAVSGHHALILNILRDSFLEDLNSTNGTYVNGKLIKKHALQDGDVITVGHHQLKYLAEQVAANGPNEFERDLLMRPGIESRPGTPSLARVARVVAQSGASPQPTGESTKTALPQGRLQVLSGSYAGKQLELTKALTTLGRPGVQVAAITRRADGFYVVHVESGQGQGFPTVNGREIGAEACRLNDNDVIELAGVKMGFYAIV